MTGIAWGLVILAAAAAGVMQVSGGGSGGRSLVEPEDGPVVG